MKRPLEPDDFATFFHGVRGKPPFAWQRRFVEQVLLDGRWPELVDLPTGAGKTALLDIAVFLLALDAEQGTGLASRRTALVVDRRIVVDQAATAAAALRDALLHPDVGDRTADQRAVLRAASSALRGLSGGGPPLVLGTLRGGLVRDEAWARRPDVPAVLSSTVDQIGSRMLFRGYGISEAMWPIHAGLLGTDTLILLDEVHLAQPFAQTLRTIAGRYQDCAEVALPSRWRVVELSATPDSAPIGTFRLEDSDKDPATSPVLTQRLLAHKPAELRSVTTRANDRGPLVAACIAAAREHLARGAGTVGVVVNRVASAHAVHTQLSAEGAVLLTGRMRPLERDEVLAELLPRLATGREPRADDAPIVVVGTQCIEAGADFDFDALVTECASLDALRQRFGRLDRSGDLSASGASARGTILAREVDVAVGADDPVYGTALTSTWEFLQSGRVAAPPAPAQAEQFGLDFGIEHLRIPDDGTLGSMLAPRPRAPHLFPSHLDAWVQTSPVLDADPDPALWLHGLRPASTDVSVVWRADMTEDWLRAVAGHSSVGGATAAAVNDVLSLVSACPPAAGEAAQVPLRAFRRWLVGEAQADAVTADVDTAEVEEPAVRETTDTDTRPYLRWRGEHSTVEVKPSRLRPGDVVVIPSAYGGLAARSWDPASLETVADLGDLAQLRTRRRVVLRLVPPLWDGMSVPRPATDDDVEAPPDRDVVREWLRTYAVHLGDARAEAARLLLEGRSFTVTRVTGPTFDDEAAGTTAQWFVASRFVKSTSSAASAGFTDEPTLLPDADSEPETSAFTGATEGEVTLEAHLGGVEAWVAAFAHRCGVDAALASDLALAGRVHDVGKLDPRFQLWLRDGDALAAAAAEHPIAKSALGPTDRARRRRARERSGYPVGARHEMVSVGLIRNDGSLAARAHDWDLVLHLVASHHGYARPFAPVVLDLSPQEIVETLGSLTVSGSTHHGLERLDSGIADRFWLLVRRYGWFRLAWLEALLRLADHCRSAQEQEA